MAKKKTHKISKISSKEAENGKVCAILSYLLIGIIWFFVDEKMKKNKFAKFHVKQGLVLLIAAFAIWIVERILIAIFFNPFSWGGLGLLGTLFTLIGLAELVLVILGIINAANGHEKELPVIGQFASRLNF